MYSSDIANAKVKLSGILMKSKFDQALFKRMDDLLSKMQWLIWDELAVIGSFIVRAVREHLATATPSGRKYAYVDEDFNLIKEHTASADGDPPMSFSGLLMESIDYRVLREINTVEVGVWSNDPWQWETLYYVGLENRKIDEESDSDLARFKSDGYHGIVVVDEGGDGTPVSKYAFYLEEGTEKMEARPFIKPVIESEEFRKLLWDFRKELPAKLRERMKRKKVPVYFKLKYED
jgi:hypothetical protein